MLPWVEFLLRIHPSVRPRPTRVVALMAIYFAVRYLLETK